MEEVFAAPGTQFHRNGSPTGVNLSHLEAQLMGRGPSHGEDSLLTQSADSDVNLITESYLANVWAATARQVDT